MTKHYFVSYITEKNGNISHRHCMIRITNKSLDCMCNYLAKSDNVSPDRIIITCLKDLSKEEYEMLKGYEE